tara:strand:+ start:11402 stop:12745 length:1344 start_codon:yes stop_codon:yes gene_type:complete
MSDVNKLRYLPRQPIEIILNSKRGTQIGSTDGHKRFELDKEIVARKDENLLLYLKKAFIPFSFYCVSANQNNNIFQYTELQTGGNSFSNKITVPDGNYSITELLTVLQTDMDNAGQTINSTNNKFEFKETKTNGATAEYTLTLTSGDFTISEVCAELKSRMESASSAVGFNYTYNVSFDSSTNKVTFALTGGTLVQKTNLLFSGGIFASTSVGSVIGFTADVEITTSSSATSDGTCDPNAGHDFKYTLSYDVNTNKASFLIASGTNPSKTTLNFNTGSDASDSIRRVLGFSDADVEFTTTTSATSDLQVDMADGLDSLHLKSNLVGDNIQSTAGAINGGELLIIPVNLSPFSILYYSEDANPFKHKLSADSIKLIEIKFTDNNDNVVDFNSIPYTLILVADFSFNPDAEVTTKNKSLLSVEDKITNNIINKELENKQLFNMLMNKKE